jgi:isopenicillin N synthase-like dioxygenase
MSNIPSLDLNTFIHGNKEQKQSFVQSLGQAYEDIGFAAIKNHLLSEDLVKRLYDQTTLFFNLPETTKNSYANEDLAGQRGYTGWGKEHAKGKNVGDLKEFWHFGQYIPQEFSNDFDYPDNLFVDQLPEFNKVGEQAFKALEETGKHMLRAMALYLNLD